jgi:DNA-binding Lrp family transcriptional regulator
MIIFVIMYMDRKDLLILKELDLDVRASIGQIARKTRISKETVQYRIQRLEKEKIIQGYWGFPNIGNDTVLYKVFLKNKGLSSDDKNAFEKFTSKTPEVSWFAKTTGSWTYIITLVSCHDWKISQFLSDLFEKFSDKFTDIQIIKSISAISLREKYLFDELTIKPIYNDFLKDPISLNETEKKVIQFLSINARAKYIEIAKKLNCTGEAISQSFKQITKKKAIKDLKLRVNHQKLGFSYYHLMIGFSNGESIKRAEEYFTYDKTSVFLMRHVGKYQLHVEIVCPSSDIDDIVDDFLDSFSKDVADYNLCKIEKEFKIQVNQGLSQI